MALRVATDFLSGVIEGFYGPPWSRAERLELFGWMQRAGLNTYFYAPKDDPHHRAVWREAYGPEDARELRELIEACGRHGLRFVYALGPGLDLSYTRASDRAVLQERFAQLLELGCRDFCLLFDDIPDRMDPEDRARWGSFAAAQCAVANEIFAWSRSRTDGRFLFCPTPYCGRMAAARLGGEGYLAEVGRLLRPEIDVFWTGPDIVSREVTVGHLAELEAVLRRKPVLWDNLHANDYDGRRFYCGPYDERSRAVRGAVRGILANPNTEFPLNFNAVHTLGSFLHGDGAWDARAAYLAAWRDWQPAWSAAGRALDPDLLVLLGDCYYLPYADGPAAAEFFAAVRGVVERDPASWGPEAEAVRQRVAGFRDFCHQLITLRNRPLFHALNRRVWELREELDLLDRYLTFRLNRANDGRPFHSDFHLPQTYRGGFVPRLQTLLQPRPDGSFVPVGVRS